MSNFAEMLKGKDVLMIPVYSARSYETGEYNLTADGNVSKYLMKIIKSNAEKITIFYPDNSINLDKVQNFLKENTKQKVKWVSVKYGKNAQETRNMGRQFFDYIDKKYDIIISEINTLAEIVANGGDCFCNKNNFIYWVGTHNIDGTRWDTAGHEQLNKRIAQEVQTACLLPAQVPFLGGKAFEDEYIYESKYFDKKIIFFPFRLTDTSYKLDLFMETIYNLRENNFVVLYTDPNDSGLLNDADKDIFIKVPANKFVYLSILKGKPIIPFLDDLEKNSHSNIFEFMYYNCKVIMYENKNINFETAIKIKNDKEFSIKLQELLAQN